MKKLKNISRQLSPTFKPIKELLEIISKECKIRNIKFFIVGAFARDLLLNYAYSIDQRWRATVDIDIAVNIKGWKNFELLKADLTNKYKIISKDNIHRFYFDNLPFDIIPYGKISDDNQQLYMPPDFTRSMNVIGFEEVYNTTEQLVISEDPLLRINVASLLGLVVLKIFSWKDGLPHRNHDVWDIGLIIKNYLECENSDRFYESDLLEVDNFDYETATAEFIGRDIREVFTKNITDNLLKILEEDKLLFASALNYRTTETGILVTEALIKGLKGI